MTKPHLDRQATLKKIGRRGNCTKYLLNGNRADMEANNFPFSETGTTPDATTQTAVEQTSQTDIQPPLAVASDRATIRPIYLVRNAFGNKAQVDLLSVKRVRDPELRTLALVDIQMHVRRIEPEKADGDDAIELGSTVARNPDTSDTYQAVNKTVRCTGMPIFTQCVPVHQPMLMFG